MTIQFNGLVRSPNLDSVEIVKIRNSHRSTENCDHAFILNSISFDVKVIETNHESKSITHFTTRFWMKQPSNRHVCLRNVWPHRICWPNRSSIHSITIAHHHLNRNTTGTQNQLTLNRFGYLFSWNVHFKKLYFIFRKSLENELTL